MSENLTTPIELLSTGNIVSASIRIYRDNFQSYFGVAIRATLWFLLPFLALIPVSLILSYGQANISNSIFFLLIPVWLLLFAFCTAKSIVNSAIINRLVFGILANQPETVREVRRNLTLKMRSFFWAFVLLFLIVVGIYLSFPVAIVILISIILLPISVMAAIANIELNIQPDIIQNNIVILAIIISGFIGMIFIVTCYYLTIRLLTRFFILDMPLAVEENMTATKSLGRSWELTKGYIGRIFVILLTAILVALPISMVLNIISEIFSNILILKTTFFNISFNSLFDTLGAVRILVLPFDMTILLPLSIIVMILGNVLGSPNYLLASLIQDYAIISLSNILLLPFWQTIKAVIYYDFQTSRKGMGLQLRKQDI
ncbi:MAG: hypothetical protein F6K54_24670 [Okeania sp. SIO3B5]|uniref:hypothetical protein n=1 Tax=Okeania sp. SIO3B5 TaxID=2607811 RepID=UPI0013FF1CFF|nr:hypothetical protein [Okeania sp. SIO3B5]NEO55980.1 hypothetical protein [Okeania sp. SIO3B5]